jgi:hypothetical protein
LFAGAYPQIQGCAWSLMRSPNIRIMPSIQA